MRYEKSGRKLLGIFLIVISTIGIICSVVLLSVGYVKSMQKNPTERLKKISPTKRVLFISSYSETQETVATQLAGINSIFDSTDIFLNVEYMDMKNFNTTKNVSLFYDQLKYKLSNHERYMAVITGDDAALEFVLLYQHELFEGIPIVFMGINDFDRAEYAAKQPNITGSTENFDFANIIDVAIKLNPVAKKIVGIYDTTISGLGDEKQFFGLQQRYPDYEFVGIKTSDYSRYELGKQISELTNDCIAICLSAYEDKNKYSHTITETAQFFYSNARIPVYTKLWGSVGKGFLGGYLYDHEESGRYSASLVTQFFLGKKPSDFPLKTNMPSQYFFDDSLLKHFKLDASKLPSNVIYINKHIPYWQQYSIVIVPFLIIITSLGLLLAFVISNAHQLKITQYTDLLTKLPNRDAAQKEIAKLIQARKDFSLLMLDVDDLKSINDFYSYACGDFIIKELAQRLKTIGNSDDFLVARYGGDEFAIIWEETLLHKNSTVLFLLKQLVVAPFEFMGNQIFIRISIGIVNRNEKDEMTMEDYFSNADTAMTEAKSQGKNKTVFFTNEMRDSLQTKQEITKILEKACNREDGFYVLYQPQIDITTGEIHGYEALCRLKTVKIFPGQFIPIAEESGLITKIGRIVTEQVIRQMVEWRRKGITLRKVSINYSAAQMADREYVTYLKSLLEKNKIDPSLIEIEITESLFMGNKKLASELAKDFQDVGVRLALDDFGTGYSSLSYLTYIPVETIKLDKTLVDAYLQDGKEEFIRNIISLVHSLNMKLIVEGVEQRNQYELLKNLKGDIIQGYYFSKPIPAKEIETFTPDSAL